MKKQLAVAMLCGIAVGFFTARFVFWEHYTVQIMNEAYAIKINTRTGETWMLNLRDKMWQQITTAPNTFVLERKGKSDMFDKAEKEINKTNAPLN
jgi:hypothetical protein